jgi:hypothetical protein
MGIIDAFGRHHRCQIIHLLLRSVVPLLQLLLLTLPLINGIDIECRAKGLQLVFVC